jgi:osmoprotectant transport system permease protein
VTLAAYIGLGGLGLYIISGLALRQFDQMLGAALVIVALALVLDGLFALAERLVVPRGVSAGRASDVRTRSPRARAVAE